MKLIVDLAENKVASFMKMIKELDITAEPVSNPDAELLKEIKEIKKAFENAEKLKSGKLKSRPIDQLLNEL